ncbi:ABC transporter permease [Rhodococcus artemisiae]|uniref:Autoinducer 2 import system permease protein LsrD n=1 Tax=Rhodococcus artemisiae TaxID=714159 RepID=A0ABU7LKU6_9NOCA|nr:ABC transporter permease [Rhodococcus artemisiae]MEE2062184.1 ABC transporter permease [Rhodococcus artemisiae]
MTVTTTPTLGDPRTEHGRRWSFTWTATSSVISITVALFLFSWLVAPGSVSGSAIDSLLPFAGILAIAAIGQTLVVMLKGIDLSLPGMMTLAALVSSQYAQDHGTILSALAVVTVLAIVVGLVNGIVISVFSVTPLVATLAVNAVLMGAALAYSGGTPTRAPKSVSDFSLEKTLGVSNTVWLAVLLVVVTVFATGYTTWGRKVVAVGSNERTARAAGVHTGRIKISGYVAASLCYSGAGVLLAGYVSTPSTNAGTSYLLPAIAAVVVGGTALSGGRGNIIGSAVGALFLSQLTQLVLSLGAPSSTQFLVQAAVIAIAVGVQQLDLYQITPRLSRKASS